MSGYLCNELVLSLCAPLLMAICNQLLQLPKLLLLKVGLWHPHQLICDFWLCSYFNWNMNLRMRSINFNKLRRWSPANEVIMIYRTKSGGNLPDNLLTSSSWWFPTVCFFDLIWNVDPTWLVSLRFFGWVAQLPTRSAGFVCGSEGWHPPGCAFSTWGAGADLRQLCQALEWMPWMPWMPWL